MGGVWPCRSFVSLNAPDEGGAKGSEADPAPPTEVEAIEPVLKRLPSEQRDAIIEVVEQQLSHSGPLPPPAQLREYETVLPGLAERIVRLTEREQEHRHEIVDLAVRRSARLRDRGQALGMLAMVLVLAFCLVLIHAGQPATAGAVAIALVIGVVSIFVIGRRADLEETKVTQSEGD